MLFVRLVILSAFVLFFVSIVSSFFVVILFSTRKENVAAVNEALSELYIEDEDHDKLRESVDDYDNFDQVRSLISLH